jgi:hypothetical protein
MGGIEHAERCGVDTYREGSGFSFDTETPFAHVPEIGTMTQWLQKTHPGATMNLFVVDGWALGLRPLPRFRFMRQPLLRQAA